MSNQQKSLDSIAKQLRNNLRKRKNQQQSRKTASIDLMSINYEKDAIKIQGGISLKGKVLISGSKNSALPIIISSILSNNYLNLTNVPNLADIDIILDILTDLNCAVIRKDGIINIDVSTLNKFEASYNLVSKMRASMLVLGPLLVKFGKAKVPMPGGCSIGERPIDMHLNALEKMGAKITVEPNYIIAEAPNGLHSAEIIFDKVSVGATEHILMVAAKTKGTTVMKGVAKEPEIIDLANCLIAMGAKIQGAGTDTITVEGGDELNGATYSVMPDRIQAGSYILACMATKGHVILEGIRKDIFGDFLAYVAETGTKLQFLNENTLEIIGVEKIQSVDVKTLPFPFFPTDLQSPWMTVMCLAESSSKLQETIFENRFNHVPELIKMGANIKIVDPHNVVVHNIERFKGAEVFATDLRSAFALIIAGLNASGTTTIKNLYHLDRGYVNAIEILSNLGANIIRGENI